MGYIYIYRVFGMRAALMEVKSLRMDGWKVGMLKRVMDREEESKRKNQNLGRYL
jgi:hypothetical protein